MDVLRREPGGSLPGCRSFRGIVPEQTAVVRSHPERAVRILAQAADGKILGGVRQVRQGQEGENAGTWSDIVHSAIVCADPDTAFVVENDRIDELVGQGGGVLAVVSVQDLFAGQWIDIQKAVVRADEKVPGGYFRQGMDMVESFSGRDGATDGTGGRIQPIKTLVPGAQPENAVTVLTDGTDACGCTSVETEAGSDEGAGSRIENIQSFRRSRIGDPEASVLGNEEAFHDVLFQKTGNDTVAPAADSVFEGRNPDGPVPVLDESGGGGFGETGKAVQGIIDKPENGVVRADPEDVVRILEQGIDIPAAFRAEGVMDDTFTVETVQSVGSAQPDHPFPVLDEGADRVRGKAVPDGIASERVGGGAGQPCGGDRPYQRGEDESFHLSQSNPILFINATGVGRTFGRFYKRIGLPCKRC